MKTILKVFLSACLLILFRESTAAQTFSKSYDWATFNDTPQEIYVIDSLLFVTGFSGCGEPLRNCLGLLKSDFDGNLVWKKVIDSLRINRQGSSVAIDDRVYVIAISNDPTEVNDEGIHFFYLDKNGDMGLHRRFGMDFEHELPYDLVATKNGLAFSLTSKDSPGMSFYPNCDIVLFNKRLSHTGTIPVIHHPNKERGVSGMHQYSDGSFAHLRREVTWGTYRGILTRIDTLGEIQWEYQTEGVDNLTVVPPMMAPMPDDHALFRWVMKYNAQTSDTSSYPEMVINVDENGQEAWRYVFFNRYDTGLFFMFPTANGDVVGGGERYDTDIWGAHSWIFRISPAGELRWIREVIVDTFPQIQQLTAGVELPNGDLVFTGMLGNFAPPTGADVWLLRTDSLGCYEPGCGAIQYITAVEEAPPSGLPAAFSLSPNPAERLTVLNDQGGRYAGGPLLAQAYNTSGVLVMSRQIAQLPAELDVSSLPPGIYLWQLLDPRKGVVGSVKMVKR